VWLTLQLDDGGFDSVVVDSMPMKRSSSVQTQTAVFEDEAIMLAGYLRDIEESGGWGIPYLRDIPFIGWLFGGASTHKETVQRMFILTPRVVDLDAAMLARLQATRLRDVTLEESLEDDAKESDNAREIRDIKREELDELRNKRLEALVKELRELQKARKEAMARAAASKTEAEQE
jgi:type II secretory pathway component GspD/PulD (secretin)